MLGKIFSNRLYMSVVGVVAILVFGLFYLFAAILDRPLTDTPMTVSVQLNETGGLFKGSAVTYRGVKVGKVTAVTNTDDGVEAALRLNSGIEIPEDTDAIVRSLSPIGEQYLDFQPQSDGAPFLEEGATIPATSTDIPKSLGSTVQAIDRLLRQIDDKQLQTFLKELSTGLDGTGQDIGRMVDQGALIVDELDRIYPQTESLLRNSDTVLDIGTDNATALRDLATTSKQFAAFLKDYDPEFRNVLDRTPGQLETVGSLVGDLDKQLPSFLNTSVTLLDIFRHHDPHLRALLQNYAPGLGTLNRAIHGDALQLFGILNEPPRCDYPQTTRHDAKDTHRSPFQTDGRLPRNVRCQPDASFATLQRGAAHAPGPVR